MSKLIIIFLFVFIQCFTTSVFARDSVRTYPIQSALENGDVRSSFRNRVRVFWGDEKHPRILERYQNIEISQRTAIMERTKKKACERAFSGALKAMQERALQEGGNGVVNIQSNIQNNPLSSSAEYDCLVGSMFVRVVFTADVVELGKSNSAAGSQPSSQVYTKKKTKKANPLILAVQQALIDEGYDPGGVDGFLGNKTMSSLLQYQRDSGIPESGIMDQITLISLGIIKLKTDEN